MSLGKLICGSVVAALLVTLMTIVLFEQWGKPLSFRQYAMLFLIVLVFCLVYYVAPQIWHFCHW